MPNHLEQVVRPSENPRIRPGVPTQIFVAPKAVVLQPKVWGNSGNSIFDLQAHTQQELPQPTFEETKRKYDVVRVMNPDDKSQFVDTEQMTEYQGRNQIDKSRTTLRFAGNQNTENTKIISKNNIRTQPGGDTP